VPEDLLKAVAAAESSFQPGAVSGAGAEGLMQLMPSVASSLGVNPFNPGQSITGAARLLSSYHDQFGSWPLALAAYNAGPGAVQEYSGIPPYAQTTTYVSSVLSAAGIAD
jgi:soluble lytic murein transglycosylase-like protein